MLYFGGLYAYLLKLRHEKLPMRRWRTIWHWIRQ